MKNTLYLLVLLSLFACNLTKKTAKETSKRPNIILIMTDDQGYGDLGIHGNENIQTPHLDQLSRESVNFSNFHVGTTCAPTRAGLMSGVNCNRTGTWHTVIGRSFLSTRFPTIAEQLQENGYQTAIFGKWHLGDNYPFRPQDRGFQEVLIHGGGGVGQTPDYWNNDYFDDTYFHNGEPKKFEGYCTDIWFREATKYMEEKSKKNEPFFCYISTNAPHGPHHVAQKYIDLYKENEAVVNPNFYGQITNIDDNIGKLETQLEELGLKENTILIFMTDNGTSAGARFDKERYVTKGYNAKMRGQKGSEYEGGHRVPLFMRFPESMKIEKKTFEELVNYTDIAPTLLDVLDLPKDHFFDGNSIKELLTKGKQADLEDRIVIVDTQRKETPKKWKNASVMQNTWRLVNNKELYNLTDDPSQRKNIIEAHPEKAQQLSVAYETWWEGLQKDIAQENRIIIGSKEENPTLLTAHDWRTTQSPPWHQQHIRAGKVDNAHWYLEVAQAGDYRIRLYRWPPELAQAMDETVAQGDKIDGGSPFKEGVSLEVVASKIMVQDQMFSSDEILADRYFEFTIPLKEEVISFQTFLTDKEGVERGAYYVEIELIDGEW
ncbi:MAG: arylsulfatase [Bacteroidota bacterium]